MEKYNNYSFRDLQMAVKKKGLTADGTREELIAKLEGKPFVKEPDVNSRLDRLETMIMSLVQSKSPTVKEEVDPVQEEIEEEIEPEEEEFEEEIEVEEKQTVKPLEPKIYRADLREKVVEAKVSGGAPEDMLLNDYLIKKGITFNELNSILRTYINKVDTGDTVRVTTIDELEAQIKIGIDKAKAIEKSGKTRVEITKDIHVVDALRKLGWESVNISGATHTMEKLQ